jgi:hypothetical protein
VFFSILNERIPRIAKRWVVAHLFSSKFIDEHRLQASGNCLFDIFGVPQTQFVIKPSGVKLSRRYLGMHRFVADVRMLVGQLPLRNHLKGLIESLDIRGTRIVTGGYLQNGI